MFNLNYLNHDFILLDNYSYSYSFKHFKCSNCKILIGYYFNGKFDNYYVVDNINGSYHLKLTCNEQIIKNLLE